MENASIEHEDMDMRLFTSSPVEEALYWFRGLPNNHLTSYKDFGNLFKSR